MKILEYIAICGFLFFTFSIVYLVYANEEDEKAE